MVKVRREREWRWEGDGGGVDRNWG